MPIFPIMLVALCCLLIFFFVVFLFIRKLNKEKAQQEFQMQLARSAGSLKELSEFLHSESGRNLVRQFGPAASETGGDPVLDQFVRSLRWGTFLLIVGLGLLIISLGMGLPYGWRVLGSLGMFTGFGLLASAYVARALVQKKKEDV